MAIIPMAEFHANLKSYERKMKHLDILHIKFASMKACKHASMKRFKSTYQMFQVKNDSMPQSLQNRLNIFLRL